MNEVRPRSRRSKGGRAREIQGVLVMHGPESEETGTDPTALAKDWRTDPGGSPPSMPTRAERATFDVDVKPLPHRHALAAWPDEWRERWGRRANDLEEAGLSWRDAEGRAFLEVWNDWRISASVVSRN